MWVYTCTIYLQYTASDSHFVSFHFHTFFFFYTLAENTKSKQTYVKLLIEFLKNLSRKDLTVYQKFRNCGKNYPQNEGTQKL